MPGKVKLSAYLLALKGMYDISPKVALTPKTTGVYVSLNNPMIRDILWNRRQPGPWWGLRADVAGQRPCRAVRLEVHRHDRPVLQRQQAEAARLLQSGQIVMVWARPSSVTTSPSWHSSPVKIRCLGFLPIIENEHEPKKLRVRGHSPDCGSAATRCGS